MILSREKFFANLKTWQFQVFLNMKARAVLSSYPFVKQQPIDLQETIGFQVEINLLEIIIEASEKSKKVVTPDVSNFESNSSRTFNFCSLFCKMVILNLKKNQPILV